MSTSTEYNFINADISGPDKAPSGSGAVSNLHSRLDAHRQTNAMSPASSNSSSSLYQLFSYPQTSSSSSSSAFSATTFSPPQSSSPSSSASSTSSEARCNNNNNSIRGTTNFLNSPHSVSNALRAQRRCDLLRQSSVTPTQGIERTKTVDASSHASQQLYHSYTLHSLEPKPLKPYKTNSEYLEAMQEDLAEWLSRLYPDLDLNAENFFTQLGTGAIICRHANNVTRLGRNFLAEQAQLSDLLENSLRIVSTTDELETNNNNSINCNEALRPDQIKSNNNNNEQPWANKLYSKPTKTPRSASLSCALNSQTHFTDQQPTAAQTINWFEVKILPFKQDAALGTFLARDNICQFILWCRSLNIKECLLFETNDLAARKNEKSFILCLLEVARIGFKVGMPTPLIIQLEQEIDREIETEAKLTQLQQTQLDEKNQDTDSYISEDCPSADLDESAGDIASGNIINGQEEEQKKSLPDLECRAPGNGSNHLVVKSSEDEPRVEEEEDEQDFGPKPQVITNDLLSLHEKVVQLLCQCTCPTQFPMVRVGENGKYKVGDKLIIFVRILRRHIMVRVGGGWQELSEFLRVKDPCRSKSPTSALTTGISTNSPPATTNNQYQLQLNRLAASSRSRLVESGDHFNKVHHHQQQQQRHNFRSSNSIGTSGQRLISNSASMSWLSSNNS